MTPPILDQPVRVVLADDDPSLRAALADVIAEDRSLELVAAAADAGEAIALAARWKPDVALIDVRMPGGGGTTAARRVRQVSPDTAVVALSAAGDRHSVVAMVEAGAVGYLVKGCPSAEVIDSIRTAANHGAALSSGAAAHVVGELSHKLQIERHAIADQEARVERIRRVVTGESPLSVAFQPIVDLSTDAHFAYEALARFAGPPTRPPNEWFAEAAETNQLVDLELRALQTAIDAFGDKPDRLLSLNVCPETLTSPALQDWLGRLPRARLGRLVLEVTEHAPIADYEAAERFVTELRTRGLRLAVDDAGAGFASLAHVLRLAPDFIKLDMSITHDVDRRPSVAALAAALVQFARETGATIVAEGIETHSQLDALQRLGIPYGQGYLLGRPAAAPDAVVASSS